MGRALAKDYARHWRCCVVHRVLLLSPDPRGSLPSHYPRRVFPDKGTACQSAWWTVQVNKSLRCSFSLSKKVESKLGHVEEEGGVRYMDR